jgi:hypothetical protein
MSTHYIYGSGMVGCLYDNGPHYAATLEDAIDGALFAFDDLETSEEHPNSDALVNAEKDLRADGIHYFPASVRRDAGADYIEISECDCDDPSEHGEGDL